MTSATKDKSQLQIVALVAIVAVLAAAGIWQVSKLGSGRKLTAYFSNASALFEGNSVDLLGVPIGTIDTITPQGDRVKVDMTITDADAKLPADAKAAVISPSLVTGRDVQLFPPWKDGPQLADGAVIPLDRTAVPLGVDDLTRTATDLSKALGPNGLNKTGVLSDSLTVLASNLDGNGKAANDTIRNLGDLGATLNGSSKDLFGTVTELQKFTAMLKNNDGTIREFTGRIADVTGVLAGQRKELAGALADLGPALDDVTVFVRDNRALVKSNVDKLVDVTRVLVDQRKALTETLDVAPAALNNLANIYDATTGTLNTRANINELANPPIYMLCNLVATGAPQPAADVLKLKDICAKLPPIASLPSVQQVITGFSNGQSPIPGLVLPGLPAGVPAALPGGLPGGLPGALPGAAPAPAGATAPASRAPGAVPPPAPAPVPVRAPAPPPPTSTSSGGGLLGSLFGGGW